MIVIAILRGISAQPYARGTCKVGRKYTRRIEGFLSETEFASLVGLTTFGIRAWRRRNYGPVPVKVGRAVFYREQDAFEFLGSLTGAEK